MHELYELKEKLMKELTEYSQNGKFSKEDAENIKYISSAIDHICNIVERMEDEDGYSQRGGGGSYAGGGGGGNRRSYAGGGGSSRGTGGGSYAGNSYEGGGGGVRSYARGRGRNARRNSMGQYSREGGYSEEYSGGEDIEEMVESIKGMMQELPQEVQMDAKRFVQKLEQSMM